MDLQTYMKTEYTDICGLRWIKNRTTDLKRLPYLPGRSILPASALLELIAWWSAHIQTADWDVEVTGLLVNSCLDNDGRDSGYNSIAGGIFRHPKGAIRFEDPEGGMCTIFSLFKLWATDVMLSQTGLSAYSKLHNTQALVPYDISLPFIHIKYCAINSKSGLYCRIWGCEIVALVNNGK